MSPRLRSVLHWGDLVWDIRQCGTMQWSRIFRCGRLVYSEGFSTTATEGEMLDAGIAALGYREVQG